MSHFQNLSQHIPGLKKRKILEVGSGGGGFLVEAAQEGARAVGIDIDPTHIRQAQENAQEAGVSICIVKGDGERLPFPDNSLGFEPGIHFDNFNHHSTSA